MPDPDLLHDPAALAEADRGFLLPAAASAGAQVRAVADQLAGLATMDRPRAMVVVGARAAVAVEVLTALAGSTAPAPILAATRLPGWIGALDVIVVLAAAPDDEEAVRAAETAMHRGATVVVRGAAIGPVALAAAGNLLIPGIAVPEAMAGCGRFALVTGVAAACGLLRAPDWAAAADLLDAVTLACHPGAESFVNPAIGLAEHLAGGTPLLIGADPAADAVAGHAVAVLAEVAGVAATRIDSAAAADQPRVAAPGGRHPGHLRGPGRRIGRSAHRAGHRAGDLACRAGSGGRPIAPIRGAGRFSGHHRGSGQRRPACDDRRRTAGR